MRNTGGKAESSKRWGEKRGRRRRMGEGNEGRKRGREKEVKGLRNKKRKSKKIIFWSNHVE